MRALIVGAGGCIGSALCRDLTAHGHQVAGVCRSGADLGVPVIATEAARLTTLKGYDVAYYLPHSLRYWRYAAIDRELATRFAALAARDGVRVVYLGALGHGRLSRHVASRQEVGRILCAGADTVEIRAPMIIAAGSASLEALRFSVRHWPAYLSAPPRTPLSQPIALTDVLRYLRIAAELPPGRYEIGGRDVLGYHEMMERFPGWRGHRRRGRTLTISPYMIPLGAVIYARGLSLPVPMMAALLAGLRTETRVRDPALMSAAGFVPLGYREALDMVLKDQVDTR